MQGLSPECAAQLPPDEGLLPYTGIKDSHPYAVTPTFFGWYIADAAVNDILFVSWFGQVRTVAVLPAQAPVLVTAEAAASGEQPLPPCVVGSTFIAEPVPTDVEIGPGGNLYVSTLPGGPEDPSLGARGSVYKVSPWRGKVSQIATGFAGAANLAVSPWGQIYVSGATGPTGSGGKLPFYDKTSQIDTAFRDAITKTGVKAGDLLAPVKSAFGWHVIQIMYPPTNKDELAALKVKADAGADFGALARDFSEAPDASTGGDLGWLAKGQFDPLATDAIFAAEIGKTSAIVTVPNDGIYLFKVDKEEVRTPEGRQLDAIKAKAFDTWYTAKKDAATITRDPSITGATS